MIALILGEIKWYVQRLYISQSYQIEGYRAILPAQIMDFLDPAKERRNRLFLFVGYGLVALAIGIASLVLLYASYGYSVDRQGEVSQHGLVFVSSQPSGASISMSGKPVGRTNTKLDIDAGNYTLQVSADGYRSWQHQVFVNGGDLQRFDYPFLIPDKLTTTTVDSYAAHPLFTSQSPDKRLVLLAEPATPGQFTLLNIRNTEALTTSIIKPPETEYTAGSGAQSWTPLEWTANNRFVLFAHTYVQDGIEAKEYIIINVTKPEETTNVTKALGLELTDEVSLFDQKQDQVYVYSPTAKTLKLFSINSLTPRVQLSEIIAYKTYANDTVLYATTRPPSGKDLPNQISIVLQQGSRSTTLRRYPAGDQTYLLDLARYDSGWYVVIGSSSDRGVYIYKNPQTQVLSTASLPNPWRFLKVANPTYIAFSDNARFVLAQSNQRVAVYDAENVETSLYTLDKPIDQGQEHLIWMDGHRLLYVSGGQLYVTDYDQANTQSLGTAFSNYEPLFTSDYHGVFTISPLEDGKASLRLTSLVVKQ